MLGSFVMTTDQYDTHIAADPAQICLSVSRSTLPSVVNKTSMEVSALGAAPHLRLRSAYSTLFYLQTMASEFLGAN